MAEIYISKKIKITIHDPIFSGVYVFDRDVGGGDSDLYSPNWILNDNESDHNLIVYQHSVTEGQSPQNNKLLVSLNDNPNSSFPNYKGYIEIKSSLYKGENNVGAMQIEDAYAFPAHMIFTAIQPAGPFYSEAIGTAYPRPVVNFGGRPSGHRLVFGFCLPLTWNESYNSWRVINGIKYSVNNNILINYAGTPFNDGNTYFSSTDQDVVSLNNRFYLSGTIDPIDSNSSGYISNYTTYFTYLNMACDNVPVFGFGFRCSASGLGFDQGYAWNQENYTYIHGIGPSNIFETYYAWDGDDPDSDLDLVDTRPFFDNKIPVSGTVEFIYGCKQGIDCSIFDSFPNPEIIEPFTKKIGTCPRSSLIGNDYLCGPYAMQNPNDSHWISNDITGSLVIFSGVGDLYPAVKSGINNDYITYKSSSIDPIILIPYTGDPKPSYIRNWISGTYITFQDNINEGNTIYASNTYRGIDLYWKIDYDSKIATTYIIPDINKSYPVPSIIVSGGSSLINNISGQYDWNEEKSAFTKMNFDNANGDFFIKQGFLVSGIFQTEQDEINNYVADYRFLPEQYNILYSGLSFGSNALVELNTLKPFYKPESSTAPLPAPSAMLILPTGLYDICDQQLTGFI